VKLAGSVREYATGSAERNKGWRNKMEYESNYVCKNCGQEYMLNPTIVSTDVGAVKWNKGEYPKLLEGFNKVFPEYSKAYGESVDKIIKKKEEIEQRSMKKFLWFKGKPKTQITWDSRLENNTASSCTRRGTKRFIHEGTIQEILGIDISDLPPKPATPMKKPERFTVCLFCQDKHYFPIRGDE